MILIDIMQVVYYFVFITILLTIYHFFIIIIFFYFTILYWFCCTPTWIHHRCTHVPLPEPPFQPPSPYPPSGSSQGTSPKHPVSCIEPGLVIHFLYDIIHPSMPFSQIIPPSPSPTESKDCSIHLCLFCSLAYRVIGEGNGNPLQYSCLENPMDGETW